MPKSPLDDEFDRDVFYRGEDPEADAEEDYELLPPDDDVIAGEKRRAEEALTHASKAVDLDQLYREHDSLELGDLDEYLKDFRFQFGVKHLLIAMTVLAVVFVVGSAIGAASVLLVGTFIVLASIYGWFTWKERQREQEWEAKRDELYRRHQERFNDSPPATD